jgi:hypothetical protein
MAGVDLADERVKDPRHYAVRNYLMSISDLVGRAGNVYCLRFRGVIPGGPETRELIASPSGEARRLAENWLPVLETHRRRGYPDGIAAETIGDIANLEAHMVADHRGGMDGGRILGDLPEVASEVVRDKLARVMESLRPEAEMAEMLPVVYDPSDGLRLIESLPCPVGLQGAEGENCKRS